MTDALNILVQSSDYYAPFAGVMLTSLFENNKEIANITVYLLTSDMSQKNRDRFLALAEKYHRTIKFLDAVEIDKFCEEQKLPKWHGAYTPYYKIFALSIIKDDIDRLVYLDSDMVVTGSLEYLMNVDLQDNVIGMCLDVAPETHIRKIGIKSGWYYNTGMIVFDVKKWFAERCMNSIIEHITNVQAVYPIIEQDIINVVLQTKIYLLSGKYNYFTIQRIYKDYDLVKSVFGIKNYYSSEEFVEFSNNAVILHCFGMMTMHPWNIGNTHPVKQIWNEYLKESPWFDFELIKSPKERIYKIQSILYKHFPHKLYAFVYRSLLQFVLWKRAYDAGIK